MSGERDHHSFSDPSKVRVTHCALDLEVAFADRQLRGVVTLSLERADQGAPLLLDTKDLTIEGVECETSALAYEIGQRDPILGAPLTVHLPASCDAVRIRYSTSPDAAGLQWLAPKQTAGKTHPFLYSQSQSIHARSWIPMQDSPGVRITYAARIKAPIDLQVLMSAEQAGSDAGISNFRMDLPIPSYLIALAVGDLTSVEVGPRSRVWAEPSILAPAAFEFSETEQIIQAVERMYGPYLWGRYDLLILPPAFPFGGMENPRLTFVTPTVLAGDKSLVSLISHELAHSWSGNLVTNATWRDFWLNEGFTTYIENRIQEVVYGREQAVMEQVIDRRELENELRECSEKEQILHIDLEGRDPDEGVTRIPYIKGALLLRQMEAVFGRSVFDAFLTAYFRKFAFRSITTTEALGFIRRELFEERHEKAAQILIEDWVYRSGLPACAPAAKSERLERVADLAKQWQNGEIAPDSFGVRSWRTQEWLEFLQVLPLPLPKQQMSDLDSAFHLTQIGNYEILQQWLLMSIASRYEPAYTRLEQFLLEVGRMRYIKPLYSELMKTETGLLTAGTIYDKARPGYHPIAQTALDKILGREHHFSR